ncbi:MAG TPA: hypothetical protein VFA66_14905 [Gaiellaceae bacterium]|nr:hypothetical protein [Gaiellaceae bacterium]
MASFWHWLIPIAFCAPWAAAVAWAWSRRPRDGWLPPSAGQQALARLTSD